ncbi:ComEC/Rec2 family competence protein [Halosolutus gelatinilyticus]|uniref:ComEC/Rec2 family competence protein n=1 Tax=Halosolutus gelatinilyticus TaxID=2931975 RepID=UPI001FF10ABB|nr:ComEC/Rec2 family competence protein [Halosolutus gelatinilyticus]
MRRGLAVLSVAGLLLIAGCTTGFDAGIGPDDDDRRNPDDPGSTPDGELEIHHIDVGQADATLLTTPDGETVLIDTGDWRDDGESVIAALEDRGVDRIDHLIATHAHADHIGGHTAVIEHFEERGDGVGAAYDPGVAHTSATYERYLDAIEAHDVALFEVADGDELPIADEAVTAAVLNPPAEGADRGGDIDDASVALRITFGEFAYLTTGDAGRDAEQRLVRDREDDLAADVYQAGHHGSSTSSHDRFLAAVDPEIAIVSSAADSRYGHPHDEVLESFADRGVETYWTGVHGDIVVATDGETASVTTDRDAPTDARALLEAKRDESGRDRIGSSGDRVDPIAAPSTAPAIPTIGAADPSAGRPTIDIPGARPLTP